MKRTKAETCDLITSLRAKGLSRRVIAERMGLSPTTVAKYVQTFGIPRAPGWTITCPHCGLDFKPRVE